MSFLVLPLVNFSNIHSFLIGFKRKSSEVSNLLFRNQWAVSNHRTFDLAVRSFTPEWRTEKTRAYSCVFLSYMLFSWQFIQPVSQVPYQLQKEILGGVESMFRNQWAVNYHWGIYPAVRSFTHDWQTEITRAYYSFLPLTAPKWNPKEYRIYCFETSKL